jgi:hypothetical protein
MGTPRSVTKNERRRVAMAGIREGDDARHVRQVVAEGLDEETFPLRTTVTAQIEGVGREAATSGEVMHRKSVHRRVPKIRSKCSSVIEPSGSMSPPPALAKTISRCPASREL